MRFYILAFLGIACSAQAMSVAPSRISREHLSNVYASACYCWQVNGSWNRCGGTKQNCETTPHTNANDDTSGSFVSYWETGVDCTTEGATCKYSPQGVYDDECRLRLTTTGNCTSGNVMSACIQFKQGACNRSSTTERVKMSAEVTWIFVNFKCDCAGAEDSGEQDYSRTICSGTACGWFYP